MSLPDEQAVAGALAGRWKEMAVMARAAGRPEPELLAMESVFYQGAVAFAHLYLQFAQAMAEEDCPHGLFVRLAKSALQGLRDVQAQIPEDTRRALQALLEKSWVH